jgi:translation initiation factor IF-2
VLVQQGTLSVGDYFFSGRHGVGCAPSPTMNGKSVKEAGPSIPVRGASGFEDVPVGG